MNIGLGLQVVALAMLTVPAAWLTVPWVMAAQALSGIAKDLNKMSAKSSIKLLVPGDQQGALYRWVAALTGSKNALKGVGFFLGGALLTTARLHRRGGRRWPRRWRWSGCSAWCCCGSDLGKAKNKPKFRDILSKSRAINLLSAARLFLFGARDVWFVVALPVFLAEVAGLGFLAGRRLPGRLGHRLRRRAVGGAVDHRPARGPRSGWPYRLRLGRGAGRSCPR